MADILTEFLKQFSDTDRAQIRAAEATAKGILAQGRSGVRDRLREAGSVSDRDWILEPQDRARAEAAAEVFAAYCNVLWKKVDPASRDLIEEFVKQIDRIREGVLTTYGQWECRDRIAELQAGYGKQAWLNYAQRLEVAQGEEMKSASPKTGTKANAQTQVRRRELLKRYLADHNLSASGLARRVGISQTAIQGMVKGDRTRYSEQTLSTFLKHIGVQAGQW
jgi:hypothetical protein